MDLTKEEVYLFMFFLFFLQIQWSLFEADVKNRFVLLRETFRAEEFQRELEIELESKTIHRTLEKLMAVKHEQLVDSDSCSEPGSGEQR